MDMGADDARRRGAADRHDKQQVAAGKCIDLGPYLVIAILGVSTGFVRYVPERDSFDEARFFRRHIIDGEAPRGPEMRIHRLEVLSGDCNSQSWTRGNVGLPLNELQALRQHGVSPR